MQREAIILAGGLGTRLRDVVEDIPKVMAPVGGKPFLEYLLAYLESIDFKRIVLSVGYRHESILSHFKTGFGKLSIDYTIEKEPLGTGGGIRLALEACLSPEVFIFNGDTLFLADPGRLEAFHHEQDARLSLCLKKTDDSSRYGSVVLEHDRIRGFAERGNPGGGLINGGIYLLSRPWLLSMDLPEKFSFEKDLLVPLAARGDLRGMVSEAYFIDIGVPEDYRRAGKELPDLERAGFKRRGA